MLRVGFVGVGSIAQAHLKNISTFSDVQIAAVTDLDANRAAEVGQVYGAEVYDDHERMMADGNLDAVYLCIPPFAHGTPERAAIRHKIPFYVEKPLSLEPDLPEEIAREVEAVGLITAVGFQLRYVDTAAQLQTLLSERRLAMVNGHYYCPLVPTPWWRKRELSGGQLVEQVIHIVDLIRYVTGDEVAAIFCQEALRVHTDVPEFDIADVTVASYRLNRGAIGSLTLSCALPSGWRVGIDVIADDIAASWRIDELRITRGDGSESFKSQSGDPMALADRAFLDAVASGTPERVRSTYQDALQTHRIVMAALRSVKEGRTVEV